MFEKIHFNNIIKNYIVFTIIFKMQSVCINTIYLLRIDIGIYFSKHILDFKRRIWSIGFTLMLFFYEDIYRRNLLYQ